MIAFDSGPKLLLGEIHITAGAAEELPPEDTCAKPTTSRST